MGHYTKVRVELRQGTNGITPPAKVVEHFWTRFAQELATDQTWVNNGSVKWFIKQVRGGKFSEEINHACVGFVLRRITPELKESDCFVLVTEFGEGDFSQTIYFDGVGMNAEYSVLRRFPTITSMKRVSKGIASKQAWEEKERQRKELEQEKARLKQKQDELKKKLAELNAA